MNGQYDNCFIRPASGDDAEFLLDIRNTPEIVALGSTQRTVDLAEHREWLARVLASGDHLLFVVECSDRAERIGYARLDRGEGRSAVITIAIVKSWRGRSIGPVVITHAANEAFACWDQVDVVIAYVLDDNRPSSRSFLKAGFTPTEEYSRESHQVLILERT